MNRTLLACATIAATLLLTACGGGDDDHAPGQPEQAADPLAGVPANATQSLAYLLAYLRALVASPSEDREPAALDGVTLPTSDTAEPEAPG